MKITLFKRGIAVALAILMMLSCIPQSVYAEEDTTSGTDVETLIETQEATDAVSDVQEIESTQEGTASNELEETTLAETIEPLPPTHEEPTPDTTEAVTPATMEETTPATTEETSLSTAEETTAATTEAQETEAMQEAETVQETENALEATPKAAPALKATRAAGDGPTTVRYTGKTAVGDNGVYKYGYSGFAESGAKSVPVKLKADNGETFIGICSRPDKDGYPKNSGGMDKRSYYLSITQEVTKITDPLIRKILFYGFISTAAHDAKKELYGNDYRCAVYTLVNTYYSTYKWTRAYAITHHALAKRYHTITRGDDSVWDYQLLNDTKAKVQEYIDMVSALPDPPVEYEVYRVENPANKPVSEGGKGWNDQVYFFERVVEKESVYIRVKKQSASSTYAPSVEGIKYAIYATREKAEAGGYSNVIKAEDEDGNEKAAILTVGTDGWSTNAFALEEGTYYMKEYSTNDYYLISDEIKSFKIDGENSTNFTRGEGEDDYDYAYVSFKDEPSVKISTSAKDGRTKDQSGTVGANETIIDTVSYQGLTIGAKYTVAGTLHYKESFTDPNGVDHKSGDVVVDKKGTVITASRTFVAEAKDGTIDLIYTLDSELLRGTSIVVFEDIKAGDVTLYSHADLEDDAQRIDYPDVKTRATDGRTKDHVGSTGKISIIDSVKLTNLTIGKTYTVTGTLMDKETKKAITDKEGNEVTATYGPFKADATDMVVEMTLEADVEDLAGKTTVVFEDLLHNDVAVSFHRDIKDEGQSIHFSKIGTTAIADNTEDHVTRAQEEVIIADIVRYENLLTDGREYTVKGYLVDKATGEALRVDGKMVESDTTFIPESASGEVKLTFTFDGSALEGTTIVVFEQLYYKDAEIAVHADIEDEEQTIHIPEIKTKAFDEKTLIDHTLAEKEVTVKDTVTYTNLLPGKTYTLKGYLVDKKTGDPIMIDDKHLEAEKSFTAESANGVETMEFTFDATSIIGSPIVVIEQLYYNDALIAVHADIEDEDQTIYIPGINTTATDKATGDHDGHIDSKITIADEVRYTGLQPGKTYTVIGKLMDKSTGKELKIDGKAVVVSKSFIPEALDGTVTLEFEVNSSALSGTTVVVFEEVHYNDRMVAVHADIEDEDQSVRFPEIGTKASRKETNGNMVTIVDMVSYKGLTPGKTYVVKGVLMDKGIKQSTGNTAQTSFTARSESGTVEVVFKVRAADIDGKTLVVFEKLCDLKDNLIARHEDIDDPDQTIVPTPTRVPKMGDDSNTLIWGGITLISLLGIAGCAHMVLRKRKKEDKT